MAKRKAAVKRKARKPRRTIKPKAQATYTRAELDAVLACERANAEGAFGRAAERAAADAVHRDRVCGFLGAVASLPDKLAPGQLGVLNIGMDAAKAVAAELRSRGFR